jgi:stage III sporulation protein AA
MQVIFEILPERLKTAFEKLPMSKVYELRLRVNAPIVVALAGRSFFLTDNGLTHEIEGHIPPAVSGNDRGGTGGNAPLFVTRSELDTIVHKAADYSLYAVNDQIKCGFMTIRGGVRIGITGEVVIEAGETKTIKNIQALNIRVPHQVRGCSYQILPFVFGANAPLKTLIISPPGCGKTTMLRDLAWQICDKFHLPNVLIIDERGEIAANYLGENQLDVGAFTDVISGCTKSFGFENGIRSMRPDVIITDELMGEADVDMVKTAARSGVVILASVHARGLDDIRNKTHFRELIDEQLFDRYVVLTTRDTAGAVSGVFDRNLKVLNA